MKTAGQKSIIKLLFIFCFLYFSDSASLSAQSAPDFPSIRAGGPGGLVYTFDRQGNRIPDFSSCGYAGANSCIPDADIMVVLSPVKGDNTRQIQAAIDYVASLPAQSNGLCGAVLLKPGQYHVFGRLKITSSGVVLRGSGIGPDGTEIIAAGTDRRTLLTITGKNDRRWLSNDKSNITDDYLPVNSTCFHVNDPENYNPGDLICITRQSTQEWIEQTEMDYFGGGLKNYFAWKPGSRDIIWDRQVTAVEDNTITIDAPLTLSIDSQLGPGFVRKYSWPGRIEKCAVENIRFTSVHSSGKPKDEDHSWMAVTFENAMDCWVRQFTAEGFAGSAVAIYESCKRITVEDCISLAPVSEIGGYRRHTYFTMGQQTLFLRCYSEYGRHEFSAGFCAAGPNAFVQCQTYGSLDDSGPIESLACGTLYDNVKINGAGLSLANRGSRGEGIGFAAANSVLWQCSAAVVTCRQPKTFYNWAFGSWGEFEGRGIWVESNNFVRPTILYEAQLADRMGSDFAKQMHFMPYVTGSSSSPSISEAQMLTENSRKPALQLVDYIRQAAKRNPIDIDASNAKTFDRIHALPSQDERQKSDDNRIVLDSGLLTIDGKLMTGRSTGVMWWRGKIRPDEIAAGKYGLGVTRFVPGRVGTGYTDDLEQLTDMMKSTGISILDHNYGLWYDRRRDDHSRVRRMNGDVRPPFYEQPFARSGIDTAWDGLSKYDLTKYNLWYWKRLKDFADLCDRKGLVLIHQNYFQHNILEAGAHWADCPWRSANNINDTGFPEPPPYAGDKRIFMDEFFYDVNHPVRRKLHRAYIRQCLDNFSDNANVIQLIGEEFTGPLEFVRFWLDTVIEWEKETGKKPLIGLSCTKDVQDAILCDPVRSKAVSVIDIKYWWYQSGGDLYAPEGARHLAPRQHARLLHPKGTSFSQVARAVKEYRLKYPDKAVIYSADAKYGWAVAVASGSIPNLPMVTDADLLAAMSRMKPYDLPGNPGGRYALSGSDNFLIYADSGDDVTVTVDRTGSDWIVCDMDFRTGNVVSTEDYVADGSKLNIKLRHTPGLLWIKKAR